MIDQMNKQPYDAQHPLVDGAYWLIDKIVDWAPLWGTLLVLWALTDGLVYLDTKTDILSKSHRWLRKFPCRIGIHDWGHFSDGDFCCWCSKRRDV